MGELMETNEAGISDFQLIFGDCCNLVTGFINTTSGPMKCEVDFIDSNDNQCNYSIRKSLSPRDDTFRMITLTQFDNEPPLLEELEIDPDQIREKALMIVNPFGTDELAFEKFLAEIDLFGPLLFCFLYGACLFLAGKVFIFSHIYSLSLISVLGMYGLLKLMSYGHQEQFVTIKAVASALGYGLLHLVWFSFVGIFMHLNTCNGFFIAVFAIILATYGASRILCIMSNQANRALIAYPTALIYTLFAFLVTF